jgi:K+-transporting ATPase c subunit
MKSLSANIGTSNKELADKIQANSESLEKINSTLKNAVSI